MKKYIWIGLVFIVLVSIIAFVKINNMPSEPDTNSDILVKVNNDYILKSEIDPVYEQFKDSNVAYDKIVEDTISEILVIQQASKFRLSVTEDNIDNEIKRFKEEQEAYYEKALFLNGEDVLRKKIRDNLLYQKVKNHVFNNEIVVDDNIITKFKKQEGFNGYLDNKEASELLNSMKNEIYEFAFKEWVKSLRQKATIIYE
ncbi:MAG TPA: hypothetical protein PLW02_10580 [Verrucomicrobiota bacterium]|nr:hypothetical protein [Verrucomicrobiota bacterium]